jgi:hypothetical protein
VNLWDCMGVASDLFLRFAAHRLPDSSVRFVIIWRLFIAAPFLLAPLPPIYVVQCGYVMRGMCVHDIEHAVPGFVACGNKFCPRTESRESKRVSVGTRISVGRFHTSKC